MPMKTKNKKIKIALDIDEVLAGFVSELNSFYNLFYGKKFKLRDYKFWDLNMIWGVEREEALNALTSFYKSEYFFKIKPISYSQQALEILSKNNAEFFAVTSRPDYLKEETHYWIEKFFPKKIKKIIHTNQHFLKSSEISKLKVCKEENADILVEDNLHTALECSQNGLRVFLLNKPWNQNGNGLFGIERVRDWKNLLEKL